MRSKAALGLMAVLLISCTPSERREASESASPLEPPRLPASTTAVAEPKGYPTQTVAPKLRRTVVVKLQMGGLGVAVFGDTPERAIQELSHELGRPDEDSGWVTTNEYGACPGKVRAVRWKELRVMFTEGNTDYGRGGFRHFFEWDYGVFTSKRDTLKLRTPERIGLGSTVADVRRAYPNAEFSLDDRIFGPGFTVRGPTETGILWGSFAGRTEDAQIRYLSYGAPQCGE